MESRTSNSSVDSTAAHDNHSPELDKGLSYSDIEKPHAPEDTDADAMDDYPDGGLRAWLVVLGVIMFPHHLFGLL